MAQGTPRKFSEKIAILERKQNEEQEMFHNVMRDVRAITSKTPTSPLSPIYSCVSSASSAYQQDCQTPTSAVPQLPTCSLQPPQMSTLPHPLTLAWSRAGGSLPNVHQMVQQSQPQQQMLQNNLIQQNQSPDYSQWNYYNGQITPEIAAQFVSQNSHMRTRSPGGSSHYHPYMNPRGNGSNFNKSNERIPPIDNHMTASNVHLQLPDSSWSNRARSDPTIHMNAMAAGNLNDPNNYIYQSNWTPDYNRLVNGNQGNFLPPSYPTGNDFSGNFIPQQVSNPAPGGSDGDIAGSLPNMHSNLALQQSFLMQQIQSSNRDVSGNLSGMATPVLNSAPPNTATCVPQQQLFFGQRLSTPMFACEASQSAPTSPAQSMEVNPLRQQWPPARNISTSPENHEIPNIVLTGTDGSLDCFHDLQDLHLDNDLQQLLSNTIEPLDPALETQLLN